MRSVRSAHMGKASRRGCTSCRMRRARAPYPHRGPLTQSAHLCGCRPSPRFPEAHTAPLHVPDTTPQGQPSNGTALVLSPGAYVAAREGQGGAAGTPTRGPRRPPTEALPEHLGRTVTVAGPFLVCLGAVRSGAMIGGRLRLCSVCVLVAQCVCLCVCVCGLQVQRKVVMMARGTCPESLSKALHMTHIGLCEKESLSTAMGAVVRDCAAVSRAAGTGTTRTTTGIIRQSHTGI